MKMRMLAIGLLLSTTLVILAQNGRDLYQQAVGKEQLGNYEAAIKIYERIVGDFPRDRPLVAKALVHLGVCYENLRGAEARKYYEQVISKYGDQPDMAAEAHRRLNALSVGGGPDALTQRLVATGDDAASDAFVTADGRFLVRPHWETGDLAVRDLTARETKRLNVKTGSWEESDGFVEAAITSPDQRWIAYLWFPSAPPFDYELRIMPNESGGRPRVLIAKNPEFGYFEPAGWSADGKSILVIASRKDRSRELVWVSRDDGAIQSLRFLGWRIMPGRPPSVSPDGQYIAYSALAEDPGKPPTPSYLRAPGAPPDPQHIYILRADGSQPETELVKGANINENPVWTPDGKRILFVSNRSGSFALWSAGIENGKAVDSPSLVRANITGRITPIGMTRAGSFYYIPEGANGAGTDIFLAELDPSNGKVRGPIVRPVENLVDWNRSPAWSPDRKFIAFKRRRPGNDPNPDAFDLVVHDLDAGVDRTFTDSRLDGGPPVWFHDGKSVLTWRNYDVRPLSRVDIQTGALRSVEAMAHATLPTGRNGPMALSSDDKTLYLAVGDPTVRDPKESANPRLPEWSIVSFDLATGEQKQVWTSGGPLAGGQRALGFALSPDGRSIAITLRRSEWKETRLIRVDIGGSNSRELASSVAPGMVAWTPDGSGIFYVADAPEQPRLMRIPADGGKPEFTGIAIRSAGHFSVSPDGARIAFSDSTSAGAALWAVDNLTSLWATTNKGGSVN